MGTRYPEFFAALAAPFSKEQIKTRPQGGRQLTYITARTAMNRLDDVVGPENWFDKLAMLSENSFLCELTIRLPDGSTVTKCDVGGMAGMSDAGDDDKSGASDAFKRAAVKFGVARYLYRDGVPQFVRDHVKNPSPPIATLPRPVPAPSRVPWGKFITPLLEEANADWRREMVAEGIKYEVQEEHKELANVHQVMNHLASRLVELGRFSAEEIGKGKDPAKRDPGKSRAAVLQTYQKNPKSIERAVRKYLLRKRNDHRVALGLDDGVAGSEADG